MIANTVGPYGARTTKEGQFIAVFGPAIVRKGTGDPDLES
jgi:hypothetical protein